MECFIHPPRRAPSPVLLILLGGLTSACVGTDFIDELGTMEPRIVVSPDSAGVIVSDTLNLSATFYDAFGNEQVDTTFAWESSDTSIVTIDQDGLATAVSAGQVEIRAISESIVSMPALLTVVADSTAVAVVRVTPTSLVLDIGGTAQLSATAVTLNGTEVSTAISWMSNSAAITVNTQGLVSAVDAGTGSITATADGIVSSPVSVIVAPDSRAGSFVGVGGHTVSGTATLRAAAGELIVELGADFSTQSGPDLEVFVSPTSSVSSASLGLGSLTSNSGSQSYSVSSAADPIDFKFVIIHCVAFNVGFGRAELQ